MTDHKLISAEQAQELLKDATPGPWTFKEHSEYEYPAGPEWGPMPTELEHSVQDGKAEHLFGAYNNHKMIEHPGNLPLAAAAPGLAHTVIAQAGRIAMLEAHETQAAQIRRLQAGIRELAKMSMLADKTIPISALINSRIIADRDMEES